MNLLDFQTAIQALVKTATGLDDGHVIWAKQTRDRPTRPFIELDNLDTDVTNFTEDSEADNPSPTADTFATFDTASLGIASGGVIVSKVIGEVGNFQIQMDNSVPTDPVTITVTTPTPQVYVTPQLITIRGTVGLTTVNDIKAAMLSAIPDLVDVSALSGVIPVTQIGATTGFSGGISGADGIIVTTKEHADITVQLRVFSADITGTTNAFNLAQNVRRFFGRDSTTGALGDIALTSREIVRDASLVLETEYEGRAILTLKFRVGDFDTEATTYIQTAAVQTTVAQTSGDVIDVITAP